MSTHEPSSYVARIRGGALLGPDWAMARPDFFAKSKLTRMTLKAQSTNTLPCLVCLTLLGPKLVFIGLVLSMLCHGGTLLQLGLTI
jgi:hypothetical protein